MKSNQTSFAPLFGVAAILVATVATGIVHGRLTNRWGPRPTALQASARLRSDSLLKECGSWRMTSEPEMPAEVCRILQNPTYIQRTYMHSQTGDVVRVFVIAGLPGPVSVHTPEVCYSSQQYALDGVRTKKEVDLGGVKHELWTLALEPKDLLRREPLQVCYAWSSGTSWEAAEYPRFGYGGLPHLYKLQMDVEVRPGSDAKGFDPAQDFLNSFLPQLQPLLVEGSARRGWSS